MVKSPANEVEAGRQLIFMTVPGVRLEVDDDGLIATPSADTETINALARDLGVRVRRLFGGEASPPSLDGDLSDVQRRAADDLGRYLTVDAPDERLDQLADQLLALDVVESAYVQPAPRPPIHTIPPSPPPMPNPPAGTPDFTFSQGYLQAAPDGIDALFAWSVPGGQGDGVNVIDIEGAWQLSHEDLGQHLLGLAGGTVINTPTFRHHGTAVIGVTGGDANTFGVTGISPAADTRVISHGGLGVGPAVTMAANLLSPGDILIIEAHAPGPRFGFTDQPGQLGYVAMQYWPDVFAAITYATVVRGVIVVEAAGNGAEDFDDPLYSTPPLGFPLFWSPFDRGAMDNAAILVGAGAPPPGHPRHEPRGGPLEAGLLELRCLRGRPGLGRGGHHHRVRGPAGRPVRGHVLHPAVQRHLERHARRGGRDRLPPGRAGRRGQAAPHAHHGPEPAPGDRLGPAGRLRAGAPVHAAHREAAGPLPDDRLAVRGLVKAAAGSRR